MARVADQKTICMKKHNQRDKPYLPCGMGVPDCKHRQEERRKDGCLTQTRN